MPLPFNIAPVRVGRPAARSDDEALLLAAIATAFILCLSPLCAAPRGHWARGVGLACACAIALALGGVATWAGWTLSGDSHALLVLGSRFVHDTPGAPEGAMIFMPPDARFPCAAALRGGVDAIAREAEAAMAAPAFSHVDPHQTGISGGKGTWRVLVLRLLDVDHAGNAGLMPRTMALLRRCAGVRDAMVSVMEPGVALWKHHGYSKCILRYQLGLVVHDEHAVLSLFPDGGAPLNHTWANGTDLLWDDTVLHAAGNAGPRARMLLFLDVERRGPEMGLVARAVEAASVLLTRWTPAFWSSMERAAVGIA